MIEKPKKRELVFWLGGYAVLIAWNGWTWYATGNAWSAMSVGLMVGMASMTIFTWWDRLLLHKYSRMVDDLIGAALGAEK